MVATTELRRSKRAKTATKRQCTLGSYGGELAADDLALLVNQLPRDELEKLVVKLAKESVDCGEIIQMEMGSGRLAKPVTNFPAKNMCFSGLGHLGKLPIELITEILRYIPTRELMILTSQVCKSLHDFRWLKPLWTNIDTYEVPYSTLFEIILPTLSQVLPGCIKHANIVYKTNSLPKAEKLLGILARFHRLESLKLTQLTAPLNYKKIETVRKLAEDFPGLRHIKHFSMDIQMELSRDYSIVHAERAIDLAAFWPELRTFSVNMPGGRDRLTMVYMRRLSETGSLIKSGPKTMAKNFITNISLTGGMIVDAEIFLQLGNFFPELEHLQLTQVADYGSLDSAVANSNDYDALFPPIPRLRTCEICFRDAKNGQANAFSVLFFAIMKTAPNLEKYIYQAGDHCYERLKLFDSIRNWMGTWTGLNLPKLRHLVMKDWALEWKLLSYNGIHCSFPAIEKTEAPGCISVETSDLVELLKNGGRV